MNQPGKPQEKGSAAWGAALSQGAALVRMARPATLPGGLLAYTLGAAMAFGLSGAFDWRRAALGLLVTEVTNLVASYADEYADVDTDSLTQRTHFSGGSGVLPAGLVSPAWALGLAVGFAALSVLLTAWLIAARELPAHAAWIVAVGLFGGWFYSMPPLAFERRGLGELVNGVLGGFFMPLMGYTVQTGAPDLRAALLLLPVTLIVLFGLLPVHWADLEADAAVGRRTLAMLAGKRVRGLHRAFLALGYGLALAFTGWLQPLPVTLAMLAVLPLGLWAAVVFTRQRSPTPSSLTMAGVLLALAVGWVIAA